MYNNSRLESWMASLSSPKQVEELGSVIHDEVEGRDANSLARKIIQHIQQSFLCYQETQASSRSMPVLDIQTITGQAQAAISEPAESQPDLISPPSQDDLSFLSAPSCSVDAILSRPPGDGPQSSMVLPHTLPYQQPSRSGHRLVTVPLTSLATAHWTADRHGSDAADQIASSLRHATSTVGHQSTLFLATAQLVADTAPGDFSDPAGGSPIDFDFDTTDAYDSVALHFG